MKVGRKGVNVLGLPRVHRCFGDFGQWPSELFIAGQTDNASARWDIIVLASAHFKLDNIAIQDAHRQFSQPTLINHNVLRIGDFHWHSCLDTYQLYNARSCSGPYLCLGQNFYYVPFSNQSPWPVIAAGLSRRKPVSSHEVFTCLHNILGTGWSLNTKQMVYTDLDFGLTW